MKLHYSQTYNLIIIITEWFQYLMKLHYSQTLLFIFQKRHSFQYLMKLHYSQTGIDKRKRGYGFSTL